MELSMNRLIGLCILVGVISFQTDKIYAGQSSSHYEKIKAIDSTLKKLNQNQHKDVTEKRVLVDELKDIDLKLSQLVQSLQQLDTSISNKRKTIDQLNTQLAPMQKEYDKHQKLLSKHLMLHYQLGASQPLALILNQRDPALTSRLMTYLGYINQDRVSLLKSVKDLGKQIRQKKVSEQSELKELEILLVKQKKLQQQYHSDQSLQQEIITAINQRMDSRSHRITQLSANKRQLARILSKLKLQQRKTKTISPFSKLKHRMPWPTMGKIATQPNTPSELPFNGVYIQAKQGQAVQAVHAGKVVFADWLRGYGLLIILQHDHGFMTLYANNQALYKIKGDKVAQGDKIASTGRSGGQLNDGLYFEIRKGARPLDPQKWLAR